MTRQHDTKNQHYIPQLEQRRNAIDPTQPKKKQRIYAFDVLDRENFALSEPTSEPIKYTLSFDDLFTFEIEKDPKYRHNLETEFGRYEEKTGQFSDRLLAKVRANDSNVKEEAMGVFAAKLLNFARNPHCVKKVLATFGAVVGYRFTNAQLEQDFQNVLHGSRPQQPLVCDAFDLSSEQYAQWLRLLFMLVSRPPGTNTVLDDAINGMFERCYTRVDVFEFTTNDTSHVCLLSDRGFNTFEVSTPGGATATSFEFNLCSRAFVVFTFTDPATTVERNSLRPEVTQLLRGKVVGSRHENQTSVLLKYNRRTLYHSSAQVFAATRAPILQIGGMTTSSTSTNDGVRSDTST